MIVTQIKRFGGGMECKPPPNFGDRKGSKLGIQNEKARGVLVPDLLQWEAIVAYWFGPSEIEYIDSL